MLSLKRGKNLKNDNDKNSKKAYCIDLKLHKRNIFEKCFMLNGSLHICKTYCNTYFNERISISEYKPRYKLCLTQKENNIVYFLSNEFNLSYHFFFYPNTFLNLN